MEQTEIKKTSTRGRKPTGIPLEERKQIYKKTQQERYAELRQRSIDIKQNEDITQQNLYFMTHIMKSQGLNWSDAARMCGLSQQALSWIKIKDDTKLQNAKFILRSMGMELLPEFEMEIKPTKEISFQAEKYNIVAEVPSLKNFVAIDKIVNDSLENNDDLAFLARFLVERRISLSQLSKQTSKTVAHYKNSFQKQDIWISDLYKIAECYETKIIWKIKAINK